jgi:hypothetical protein
LLIYLFSYSLIYLLVDLLIYLFIYLFTCLVTHLFTFLFTYIFTYLFTYLFGYLLTYLLIYLLIYLLVDLFTYLLTFVVTPWSRVLEKLTGSPLVKNFPAFYRTRKFITTFTSANHLSLSRVLKDLPSKLPFVCASLLRSVAVITRIF